MLKKGTFCRFQKVEGHVPQMHPRFLRFLENTWGKIL